MIYDAAIAEEERTRPRPIASNPIFEGLVNAQDLSVPQSMLFWASQCLPYIEHIPVEPQFHVHYASLLNAIDMGQTTFEFYEGMSKSGGVAATPNPNFNFWIKFAWLACSFAIGREWGKVDDLLIDTDPPHTWDGDNKQWWWAVRMSGSPFFPAMHSPLGNAEDLVTSFEDQHKAAAVAAARAAVVA